MGGAKKQMNKEFEEFRDFERQKHFGFFLPFYQKKGWKVIKDNINSDTAAFWDVILKKDGKTWKIDEKARNGEWNDCLVEIIQDLKGINTEKPAIGWVVECEKSTDFLLYGSWEKGEEIKPSSLYAIHAKKLWKYVSEIGGKPKICLSPRGFGNTLNFLLPWRDLVGNEIAKKII